MAQPSEPAADVGEGGAPASRAGAPPLALRRLAVRDFRNLERLDLELMPAGLAVVGENGHGKTNLLEAIYYLQLLRSVRGARDQDLVRFGADGFHLAGTVAPEEREIAVGFARQAKRKRARLNGLEPPRLSDALGALPSAIFSPGDVQLVAGSPSERRRYLDVVLALTSRPYLHALQTYRAALARRNAALRDVARTGSGEGRAIVWEPALAEHGAVLWRERVRWVEERSGEFARLCEVIGEHAPVRMRYASALAPGDDVAEALRAALAARRALDLRRGVTHAGPHRDDLELSLDGRDLRLFGSAGQQRTAALALRMLEASTLRDRTGTPPLLLLDDPFAELDARRAHRILGLLGESGMGQVLIAVPREVDIPAELTRLERREIREGVLT
jgi:DNA replication and repair protein RecF